MPLIRKKPLAKTKVKRERSGIKDGIGPFRSKKHRTFVSSKFACSVRGCACRDIQAAHVDKFLAEDPADDIPMEQRKGTSSKNGDMWVFPLCGLLHHEEYHKRGHDAFCAKYGINPHKLAKEAWSLSPVKGEFKPQ
jgi:hypothetical protein